MRLTDAVLLSAHGVTIISNVTSNRYSPEQLNAKKLSSTGAVFDTSSGITDEERRGRWWFVVPRLNLK